MNTLLIFGEAFCSKSFPFKRKKKKRKRERFHEKKILLDAKERQNHPGRGKGTQIGPGEKKALSIPQACGSLVTM